MKISVITVVFNGAATLADCLRSVAEQRGVTVEHIVIDGGSTDGSQAIIAAHSAQLAAIVSEPDRGIYHAMNKGLALATGDVVGFLNADDVYANPEVLARVQDAFSDPGVDACYADLVYVDRDNLSQVLRYWTSQPYRPGLFRQGWMPAHPTFYARRAAYERLGGYDETLMLQSDFELTMRFLEVARIPSYYVPEIWVRMRMGGASNRSLGNVWRGNLEACQACRKHGLRVWAPWFVLRKILSRIPQFFRKPLVSRGAS